MFDNSYTLLPSRFFAACPPTPVASPTLIHLNIPLARSLGFDPATLTAATLSGNALLPGATPIATAYAGHQFGNFVPQLGDGRAILLGEVIDTAGQRRDIQLKGAGRTPFSRGGDGRAALGPVLREYIVSEAMHALGIPTTRALAIVTTGEPVFRETTLPGAILTRVAASHIRVGTFQFFAAREDTDALRSLSDHVIARHYPHAATVERPYRALLTAVIAAQAHLVAQWLLVGFIHGVMNTDNSSIAGETIDYGPCAFMEAYDPETVFSAIDQQGRYAYANQPRLTHWNLTRLAEALLPLLADTQDDAIAAAQTALAGFAPIFEAAYRAGLCRKIGITNAAAGDVDLAQDLLADMHANGADFTRTFNALTDLATAAPNPAWAVRWRARLVDESHPAAVMRAANPAFIPRNHLIQHAITAAEADDYAPFHTLLEVLATPYQYQPAHADLARPATDAERVHRTFCGT